MGTSRTILPLTLFNGFTVKLFTVKYCPPGHFFTPDQICRGTGRPGQSVFDPIAEISNKSTQRVQIVVLLVVEYNSNIIISSVGSIISSIITSISSHIRISNFSSITLDFLNKDRH